MFYKNKEYTNNEKKNEYKMAFYYRKQTVTFLICIPHPLPCQHTSQKIKTNNEFQKPVDHHRHL